MYLGEVCTRGSVLTERVRGLGLLIVLAGCGSSGANADGTRGTAKNGADQPMAGASATGSSGAASTSGGAANGGMSTAAGSGGTGATSVAGGASGGAPSNGGTTSGVAGMSPLSAGMGGMTGMGAGGVNSAGGAGSAAGAPAAGAGGTAPLGSLTVSNLKIDPNPKMTLGCYVSWTTSVPANTEVQFGVGGYQFHTTVAEQKTDHQLFVVGMHAQTAYQIKAVSTSDTATGSAEGTFTTGSLPTNMPQAKLVTMPSSKMQPGWTLTNIKLGGTSSNQPGIIAILDEQALPVWYYVHGTTTDQFGMTSTDWLPNGHVLVGNASAEPAVEVDLENNIIWTGPTGGTPAASHHTGKLNNGDYAIVRESNASARVEELSPDNKVVWTWDLYDYIKPKTSAADWCHLNSVTFDEVHDFLYFNCRFQGLFKVNRADKSILWQMGAAIDDSHSGDITYLPDNTARFNDSHDPEIHDDGTILFYDNQGWSQHTGGEGNGSYHTRVVEYQLDEPNKTATLSWEFPGSFSVDSWDKNDWATPIWGDADRLSNTNVLVTAGVNGGSTNTRIFEVTRAGEVVWAMEWPSGTGSYRADRIEQPPAQKLP